MVRYFLCFKCNLHLRVPLQYRYFCSTVAKKSIDVLKKVKFSEYSISIFIVNVNFDKHVSNEPKHIFEIAEIKIKKQT